jgi:RecA-family ATPase
LSDQNRRWAVGRPQGPIPQLRVVKKDDDDIAIIDPGQWQGRKPPARQWMIEKLFVRGSVAIVSGSGGIGKSLLVQQLCTCAVLGKPWLGLHVTRGRAVYLGCEDDEDELWRRQEDINQHYGADHADVGDAGLSLVPRVGLNNTLSYVDRASWTMQVTPLFDRVVLRCLDLGVSYVVIDTLAQTFRGNMNDPQHAVQFISQLRRLAMALDGLVILIMHPSLSGRSSGTGEAGNTQWDAAVRSRLYLHKDKVGDGLVLEHMKGNYAAKADAIPLVWRQGVYVRPTPPEPPRYYND